MKPAEILNFLFLNDNLDVVAEVERQIIMAERKEILDKHPYAISRGADGLWRTTLPRDGGGRVSRRRKTREEIEDLIIEYYKEHMPGAKFIEVMHEWLDYKLKYEEIYKQTYDRYQTDVIRFFDGEEIANKPMNKIDEIYLEEVIKGLIRDKNLSTKAYSNLRLLIRGTFKYAHKRGLTTVNIEDFFDNLVLPRKAFLRKKVTAEQSVFKDSEVEKIEAWIFSRVPSVINYGIMFAFYTGLRVGELVALTPSDVNGNLLNINKTEVRYKDENGNYIFEVRQSTKTEAGNRTVILNDAALEMLKYIRKENPFGEYLFMRKGHRIKGRSFTIKMYKICDTLAIPRRSMHKARKTYATKLLNNHVDESLIIDQMGHTNINTTKSYYYFSNAELEVARDKICGAVNY